ncbi:MAG: hypothetical protein IJ572_04460 [Bacilli bacterium]|nr:hypothetical protein [Bacilli bacterium]
MKYIIKKRNKVLEIVDINYPLKGYKFTPKNEEVKSITVTDDKLIDKILTIKINNIFTRLLMIVNDAFNSDDNPSGVVIALDEIELVKGIILNKYHKFLKKEKEELYLKKLLLIEEEMRFKYYSLQESYNIVENKGKSR